MTFACAWKDLLHSITLKPDWIRQSQWFSHTSHASPAALSLPSVVYPCPLSLLYVSHSKALEFLTLPRDAGLIKPHIISTAATPLRAGLHLAFPAVLVIGDGNPGQEHSLAMLALALAPPQLCFGSSHSSPWYICVSVFSPVQHGQHTSLLYLTGVLPYLWFAHFYKETKQHISSGKHIKRQVLVPTWRIYEKLISLTLLYTHQQNPPTPAICFEIRQKA